MGFEKKLSVATVYGKIPKTLVPPKGEEPRWLCRIVGRCNSLKTGIPSPYGDAVGVMGSFEWTNLDTGESFKSARMYVPGVLLDPIMGSMNGHDVQSIEFACDLGIRYSDKGIGYEYVCNFLVDASGEADPLARIKDKLNGALKALPAPPLQVKAAEKGARKR